MTDRELLDRARAGDRAAFGIVVGRYGPAVRRVARVILHHSADADDAAQEAFLAAWRNLARFDPARPVGPWLFRIAANAARDLRRRRRVRAAEPRMPDPLDPGRDPAVAGERREHVLAALAQLPERQRLAVVLFEVEGYRHAEIAGILDVPEGTVRSDVFHAHRALRQRLGSILEEGP